MNRDPRRRPREPARRASSRASRTSRSRDAVAPDALLPARPVEPDRLLDRRQRRRELRRRALLQVRLHDELRDAGWRSCCPTARSCTLGGKELDQPGYDLLGAFVGSEGTLGDRHRRSRCGSSRRPRRCGRSSRSSTRPARGGRGRLGDRRRRRRPGRDRDDGQPHDPGRRGDGRTPASRPTSARRWSSSSTAPSASATRGSSEVEAICERRRRRRACASPRTRPSAR